MAVDPVEVRRLTTTQLPSATDLETLKAELQWCISNNEDRPRTEFALRLALEAIEAMEGREVKA